MTASQRIGDTSTQSALRCIRVASHVDELVCYTFERLPLCPVIYPITFGIRIDFDCFRAGLIVFSEPSVCLLGKFVDGSAIGGIMILIKIATVLGAVFFEPLSKRTIGNT
jgi:hypothetical protein